MIEVQVERSGNVAVARPMKDIDAANAEEVRLLLTAAVDGHCDALIVDLQAVRYIDSAGIDMLFRLAALLVDRRSELRVVIPEGAPLRRLAEIVALPEAMGLDVTVEESRAAAEHRGRDLASGESAQ